MSVITQFFPSGGGGGGNETPGGIKIPQDGIPVEILGISGGGGPGGTTGCDGCGGSGAMFHATKYHVQPGCTVPITIGAGGAASPNCPCGQGAQGGATSFNYGILPISVDGGGGGTMASPCLCYNSTGGCPGGTGGGGYINPTCSWNQQANAGEGKYYFQKNELENDMLYCFCPGYCIGMASETTFFTQKAQLMPYPWGVKGGFPGMPACVSPQPYGNKCACGDKGYMAGNSFRYGAMKNNLAQPGCSPSYYECCRCITKGVWYRSAITGSMVEFGKDTSNSSFGYIPNNSTGSCPGGLIISWAALFGAATSSPGATDISPSTPGYYTYCFTSSGQIGLP